MSNNINQARQKALGKSGPSVSNEELSVDIQKACDDFVQRVQDNMRQEGLVETGTAINSFSVRATNTGAEITAVDYLTYLDQGTSEIEATYVLSKEIPQLSSELGELIGQNIANNIINEIIK